MIAVAVVAEEPLARAGLAAVVDQLGGVVLAFAVAGDDAASAIAETVAESEALDVIVWEAGPGLPVPFGDALGVPVLVLAASDGDAAASLAAGARGVLPRTVTAAQLEAAIIAAAAGLVVAGLPSADAVRRASAAPTLAVDALTARELEVLQLLVDGLSNKAIAKRLGVSENTVKFHVRALLGKAGARTRTELVTRSLRRGLVDL